jgi:hypothetical protein
MSEEKRLGDELYAVKALVRSAHRVFQGLGVGEPVDLEQINDGDHLLEIVTSRLDEIIDQFTCTGYGYPVTPSFLRVAAERRAADEAKTEK